MQTVKYVQKKAEHKISPEEQTAVKYIQVNKRIEILSGAKRS